jgi:hypothetical protein
MASEGFSGELPWLAWGHISYPFHFLKFAQNSSGAFLTVAYVVSLTNAPLSPDRIKPPKHLVLVTFPFKISYFFVILPPKLSLTIGHAALINGPATSAGGP